MKKLGAFLSNQNVVTVYHRDSLIHGDAGFKGEGETWFEDFFIPLENIRTPGPYRGIG